MTDALQVEDIHIYYGKSQMIQGLCLRVGDGEIVRFVEPQQRLRKQRSS
ncbi:hypothetical protein [Roseovarius sp. Pro17]|nr:hypothetical protein [Roseovarius sp. Pro17]